MNTNLYERKSHYSAKYDAQLNLQGRTYYVDDDTLKFHKAKVLETRAHDNGLLFSIVESCALDPNGHKRGFRYVIFDLFGTVLDRPDLQSTYSSSLRARKAMYEALNKIDAKAITLAGIENRRRVLKLDDDYILERLKRIEEKDV